MQAYFITKKTVSSDRVYGGGMHSGGRPTKRQRSELGERLAQARITAGLSQAELAKLMNTSQPAVAYWERNAEALRSDVIIKLTEILKISADALLGISNKQKIAAKPIGKARRVFDAVSKLPRRQQEKVLSVLEPFVELHGDKTSTGS